MTKSCNFICNVCIITFARVCCITYCCTCGSCYNCCVTVYVRKNCFKCCFSRFTESIIFENSSCSAIIVKYEIVNCVIRNCSCCNVINLKSYVTEVIARNNGRSANNVYCSTGNNCVICELSSATKKNYVSRVSEFKGVTVNYKIVSCVLIVDCSTICFEGTTLNSDCTCTGQYTVNTTIKGNACNITGLKSYTSKTICKLDSKICNIKIFCIIEESCAIVCGFDSINCKGITVTVNCHTVNVESNEFAIANGEGLCNHYPLINCYIIKKLYSTCRSSCLDCFLEVGKLNFANLSHCYESINEILVFSCSTTVSTSIFCITLCVKCRSNYIARYHIVSKSFALCFTTFTLLWLCASCVGPRVYVRRRSNLN